jgi:hypothetical protein
LPVSSATILVAEAVSSSLVTTPSWFASARSNIRSMRESVISSRVSLPSLFLSNAIMRATRASTAAALSALDLGAVFGALSRSSGGWANAAVASNAIPMVMRQILQTLRMMHSFNGSPVNFD